MMKSVLDDLRPEPRKKMWQKCERLSWKTDDERFTMFATLSDCRVEPKVKVKFALERATKAQKAYGTCQ